MVEGGSFFSFFFYGNNAQSFFVESIFANTVLYLILCFFRFESVFLAKVSCSAVVAQ